jgi:hypothetical protein
MEDEAQIADGAEAAGPGPSSDIISATFSGPLGASACTAVFGLAMVMAVVGGLTRIEAVSLPGAFGVVIFGVGAAPFQLIRRLDIYARLTGAALVGFGVVLLLGALMADVQGVWHPQAAAVLVLSLAAALHLEGLRRARPMLTSDYRVAAELWTRARAHVPRRVWVSLTLTLGGTLLWLVPAFITHDPQPGITGFLTTINPVWYVGLVLVILGFVIGRSSECAALASAMSFGLASTLTPALVYGTPRAGAAAKQMLITQTVLVHHHLRPTAGIYQAFSALFAGMAWVCDLIHVHGMLGPYSLLGLGTYWPVLIVFSRVVALRMFAGQLLGTTGRRWSAVMLVLLVDTINDANYFSPQSMGYLLSFGAAAFVVNGVRSPPLGRRATVCLLVLVGGALAVTHELTPYLTAAALFVLFVFRQAPWWSCLPIGVPALAWAAIVRNAIGQNFSFSQLFNLGNLVPPTTVGVPGLVRSPDIGYQSHALLLSLLILIALAAIGFFTNLREWRVWGYGLCPVVGIGLILVNPYGNEGIFRASLFAIPWMAVLAMNMPQPGRLLAFLRAPRRLTAAVAAVSLSLLATFVVAEWGVDGTAILLRSDIAVAGYLKSRPARDAFVISLGAGGDTIVNYPPFLVNYRTLPWDKVATTALLDVKHPDAQDLTELTTSYGAVAVGNGATNFSPLYIFWSYSTLVGSGAYAVQSPSQMERWLAVLKASSVWRVAYRSGDSYLFELRR